MENSIDSWLRPYGARDLQERAVSGEFPFNGILVLRRRDSFAHAVRVLASVLCLLRFSWN
jgi:hypothetical protein